MSHISRRRFLQLSAMAGGALMCSDLADRALRLSISEPVALAGDPVNSGT